MSYRDVFDQKLIDSVKSFPILYDPTKKSYKDKIAKDNAWKSIATNMGRDVEECRTRWRTIRDSYKKLNKKKEAGASTHIKSKYDVESLKFLESFLRERRPWSIKRETDAETHATDSECVGEERGHSNDEENEVVAEHEGESSLESSATQHLQSKNERNEEPDNKRRKLTQKEKLLTEISKGREERLQILKRIVDRKEAPGEDDPLLMFFKSMALTVAQFPHSVIAETRIKICQVVADMEVKALNERRRQASVVVEGVESTSAAP